MSLPGDIEPERRVPAEDDPGGAMVPAPDETVSREMIMLLLAFNRFSAEQIAKQLGVSAERVRDVAIEPEVQEAIMVLTSLLPRPGQVQELLASDVERNVLWIRNLREGRVDGVQLDSRDPKILAIRSKMATELLDRQAAKRFDLAPPPARAIDVTDFQLNRMQQLLTGSSETATEAGSVTILPPAPAKVPAHAPRAMTDAEFDE